MNSFCKINLKWNSLHSFLFWGFITNGIVRVCVCGGGGFVLLIFFCFVRVNERLRAALDSAKIAPLDADKLFGGGRLRRRADDAFCC